jgi:hypothetical protein
MISLHEKLSMLKDQSLDFPEIVSGDAPVARQSDRLKPELALAIR